MNSGPIALEAALRAILIGFGVSLIVGSLAFFVLRNRGEWSKWRSAVIMGGAGIFLLVVVVVYYAWPTLLEVPSLGGLSQAEAEDLLVQRGLVPEGRPQYGEGTEAGRVIPHSQSPGYGLRVRRGTMVSFAVSMRPSESHQAAIPSGPLSVSLFRPKGGEKVFCYRDAGGIYRFQVEGTSSGLSRGDAVLLVWVRPVNPPSETPGWYLQRPPVNGVDKVEEDGTWNGLAQIGNAQWPPREGDILDLAVTVASSDNANRLMADRGVVVRNQPVGIKSERAMGVIVTLKR